VEQGRQNHARKLPDVMPEMQPPQERHIRRYMRKRISEQNIFPNFDLFNEYQKINSLLTEVKIIGVRDKWGDLQSIPKFTIEDFINGGYFLDWELRGTWLSIYEMRYGLQINKELFTSETITENRVLDFLQYAANCAWRIYNVLKPRYCLLDDNFLVVLLDNIDALLERLNAHITYDKDNYNNVKEVFVVYNNELAAAVSESVSDVAQSISEYRHIDNMGDLTRKAEILCTLAKDLEPLEKLLDKSIYKQLVSDTTFLLNKTGIRHNIDGKTDIAGVFTNMDEKEREKWYDYAFQLYLHCRYAYESIAIMREVSDIKNK
jgi:hypothetical protein